MGLSANNQSLLIRSVEDDDAGRFLCKASNRAGEVRLPSPLLLAASIAGVAGGARLPTGSPPAPDAGADGEGEGGGERGRVHGPPLSPPQRGPTAPRPLLDQGRPPTPAPRPPQHPRTEAPVLILLLDHMWLAVLLGEAPPPPQQRQSLRRGPVHGLWRLVDGGWPEKEFIAFECISSNRAGEASIEFELVVQCTVYCPICIATSSQFLPLLLSLSSPSSSLFPLSPFTPIHHVPINPTLDPMLSLSLGFNRFPLSLPSSQGSEPERIFEEAVVWAYFSHARFAAACPCMPCTQ